MNDLPRPDAHPDAHPHQHAGLWSPPRLPLGAPTPPPAATQRRPAGPAPASAQDERLARLAARRTAAADADRSSGTGGPRPASSRRPHPAGRARASALALSVTTTVGLAAYLHETSAGATTAGGTAVISGSVATTTAPAGTAATAASTTTATTATDATTAPDATTVLATSTGLVDGTYTGDTASTKWGPVQVEITVSGGQIASVDVLQYPADDRKSVAINQRALPTLIADTLTAQSADVDTVSGATYTSDGYRATLQTAIDDARAAATAG